MPGGVLVARRASGDAREAIAPGGWRRVLEPGRPQSGPVPDDVPAPEPDRPKVRRRPSHRAPRSRRRGAVVVALMVVAGGSTAGAIWAAVGGDDPAKDGPSTSALRGQTSPVVGVVREVTCWNGAVAAAVRDCTTPIGSSGLAAVFPSLGDCASAAPLVPGKVEVVTCQGDGYVTRYTRWENGFDRFGYFDAEHAASGVRWTVADKFAGRSWTAHLETADGALHHMWAATYRGSPFSVEVQSATAAGLRAGQAAVEAVAPQRVGLAAT